MLHVVQARACRVGVTSVETAGDCGSLEASSLAAPIRPTGTAHSRRYPASGGLADDLAVQCTALNLWSWAGSPVRALNTLGCCCMLFAGRAVTRARRMAPCTASTCAAKSATLPGREMQDLRPDEAAAMLHVSSDTLRAWEQRFGYPHSVSRGTGQRRYANREVIALRSTLDAGLSVAAAIKKARRVSTGSRTRRRR